jgi:hypothetical protein
LGGSIYDFGNRIFGIFSCKFANAEGVVDDDDVLDDGALVVSFLEVVILRAGYFRTIFDVDKSGVEETCDDGVLLEKSCDDGVLVVSFLDNDILRAGYFRTIFAVDKSGVVDVDDCALLEEACGAGVLLEEACDDGVLVVSFLEVVILRAGYFRMMFGDDELVEVGTCFSSSSISGRTRRKGPFEMFVRWGAEGSESSLIFLLVLFFVFFDIFLKKFGKIIRNTR